MLTVRNSRCIVCGKQVCGSVKGLIKPAKVSNQFYALAFYGFSSFLIVRIIPLKTGHKIGHAQNLTAAVLKDEKTSSHIKGGLSHWN